VFHALVITLFRKATDYISTKRAHFLSSFFLLFGGDQQTIERMRITRCGQLRYVFCGFEYFFHDFAQVYGVVITLFL